MAKKRKNNKVIAALLAIAAGGAVIAVGFSISRKRKGITMSSDPKLLSNAGNAPPRVAKWAPMVQIEVKKQNGPVKVSQVLATIEHESAGKKDAMSYYLKHGPPWNDPRPPKGLSPVELRAFTVENASGHAYGLGQLIPETGAKYGGIVGAGYTRAKGGQPGDSYDPVKNIKGTVAFLNHLMNKYNGDKEFVYASYYAGSGNVLKYGKERYRGYIDASLVRESKYHQFDI